MLGFTLTILVGALTSLAAGDVSHSFNTPVSNKVKYMPQTRVHVSCNRNRKEPPSCEFPGRLHPIASELESLTFSSCTFSSDGFRVVDCLNVLGVKSVNSLEFWSPQSPLKREHLQGLTLDTLTFQRVNVSDLPGDLLQDVEVRTLEFRSSAISEIPKGLLDHASSIKNLHILLNEPVNLGRDDLASLTGLETLMMISNRLVTFGSGVFDGLENLKVLNLTGNFIETLPTGIFYKLKNLGIISLNSNPLNQLPSDLLHIEGSKLRRVQLSEIDVASLPNGLFKKLRNLEEVELTRNRLTSLPADLFSGAGALKKVGLASNKIVELPAGIFDDATELEEVDLADNELSSLPENVFGNSKLQKLNLNNNKLTKLTEGGLVGLYQLKSLSVANNNLTDIFPLLCKKINSVEEIDISHNQLTLKKPEDGPKFSIFENCLNLIKLDASYNKVPYVFRDFRRKPFEKLNLAGNYITEISAREFSMVKDGGYLNLSSNNITSIKFDDLLTIASGYAERNNATIHGAIVDLNDNPVHCDCAILDLVRYLDNKMADIAYDYVTLRAHRLRCAGPPKFANRQVFKLKSSEISCPVARYWRGNDCLETCTCLDYPDKGVMEVDCSSRNLTSAPPRIVNPNNRSIELNLSGNRLENVPAMNEGYLQKVVSLDLSFNNISSVTADVLAGSVRTLKLNNNDNLVIDSKVVKSLKGIIL